MQFLHLADTNFIMIMFIFTHASLDKLYSWALEGNFWEEGLPPCIQSQLECLHGWSINNLLWQLVLVWNNSKAERMLTGTGFTPLLVNLQSMTSKPNAGGDSKDCVEWKAGKAVHYFVHTDKITTDSPTN